MFRSLVSLWLTFSLSPAGRGDVFISIQVSVQSASASCFVSRRSARTERRDESSRVEKGSSNQSKAKRTPNAERKAKEPNYKSVTCQAAGKKPSISPDNLPDETWLTWPGQSTGGGNRRRLRRRRRRQLKWRRAREQRGFSACCSLARPLNRGSASLRHPRANGFSD